MYNRELKAFHNENRTHVTKKEFSGAEISVGRTPMGKNLFNPTQTSYTANGLTITRNADNTYTVNGTATAITYIYLGRLPIDVNKVYYGSGGVANTSESGITGNAYLAFQHIIGGAIKTTIPNRGGVSKLNVKFYEEYIDEYNLIYCVHADTTVDNVIVKPMISHIETDEYEPFIRETYPVNAPMDLKIFGNSYQKVTEQGKNLYDMDKGFDSVISSLAHTPAYKCDKKKVSKTEWLFDNMAQSKICYFVMPFKTKKNTNYVLSLTVNQYKIGGPIGIANNTTSDTAANQWNVVGGRDWYTYVPNAKTDTRISFKFNSGNYETLYFRGYFNYAGTAESYCIFKDIQLEEGTALTEYEAFVPDSPSKEYPSDICPLEKILLKCSNSIEANSTKIPVVGNAMEVTDFAKSNLTVDGKYYLADYIEYNSATDKAYRRKFIDETLFDNTLPIKDQIQVILEEPIVEEITPSETEYIFKDVKSIQDGCVISAENYATDGLPHPLPLQLNVKIKVIKG